jgi:MFS family permease
MKLLLQILGGIWADRFGGKLVLGFGVVWWSLATILTPLAAKVGLPCLLVMRAFMGIGEVRFLCLYLLCVLYNFCYLSNYEVCTELMSPSYTID